MIYDNQCLGVKNDKIGWGIKNEMKRKGGNKWGISHQHVQKN
jgi:hypothetical protein